MFVKSLMVLWVNKKDIPCEHADDSQEISNLIWYPEEKCCLQSFMPQDCLAISLLIQQIDLLAFHQKYICMLP